MKIKKRKRRKVENFFFKRMETGVNINHVGTVLKARLVKRARLRQDVKSVSNNRTTQLKSG
jgi:hypothetical protein